MVTKRKRRKTQKILDTKLKIDQPEPHRPQKKNEFCRCFLHIDNKKAIIAILENCLKTLIICSLLIVKKGLNIPLGTPAVIILLKTLG
jgi:hypothetical protein